MMDSCRTPLLLLLILHLSDTNGKITFVAVRERDNITLSCKNEKPDQSPCGNTDWEFRTNSRDTTTLFSRGQKNKEVTTAVSLSENCSLVLKNVKEEDVGYYYCRQFNGRLSTDTGFQLFVVKVFQKRKDDRVTFSCSVKILGLCKYTVKWLNNDKEVDKDHKELQTSHALCSASVSFTDRSPPSQFYQSLKCEVTEKDSKQKVTLILRPPDAKRTTSASTRTTLTSVSTGPSEVSPSKETNTELHSDQTTAGTESSTADWLLLVVVPVVSAAALFIAAVVVIVWWRHRGTRSPTDRDTVEPEDGVTYASVHFKNNNNRAQTEEEDDDAVIYSSVKTSAAAADSDPRQVYALVHKRRDRV